MKHTQHLIDKLLFLNLLEAAISALSNDPFGLFKTHWGLISCGSNMLFPDAIALNFQVPSDTDVMETTEIDQPVLNFLGS